MGTEKLTGRVAGLDAWARSSVFAVVFASSVLFGRLTLQPGTSLSMVWPAAGVAVTWFAVQRRAGTFVVDLFLLTSISLAIDVVTGASVSLSCFFVAANLVQLGLFHTLFGRWCPQVWGAGGQQPLFGMDQLFRLIGAALAGSAGGALIGPTGVWIDTGFWTWQDTLVWVSRNAVSIVLIAAAGLRIGCLVAGRRRRPEPGDVPVLPFRWPTGWMLLELAAVLTGTIAVYEVVFDVTSLPFAFLTIAFTVWTALRMDTTVVVVHSLTTGAAAVLLTLTGHGPFAAVTDPASQALVVQAFVGLLAVIGLALAMSRDERELLLGQVRCQAHRAQEHAEHMEILARASRTLVGADDAREAICAAAREIAMADGAYLLEPDDNGVLNSTATGGMSLPPVRIDMANETSQAAVVLREGRMVFAADLSTSGQATPRIRDQVDARSALWQPVFRSGRPVAVICLFFRQRVEIFPTHVPPMLETLAAEAAGVIERSDLLDRLSRAADRDPLTGLANRRRWDAAISAEISRATRDGQPLTFALLDLDHFKRYNDTRGHLAGDALLRDFAAAAGECLRDVDLLARWGGEEFALALPACSAQEAVMVADRIRAVVPDGQTCSIGISEWFPGLGADAVMNQADAALYRGKHSGRNVVVVHGADSPGLSDPLFQGEAATIGGR